MSHAHRSTDVVCSSLQVHISMQKFIRLCIHMPAASGLLAPALVTPAFRRGAYVRQRCAPHLRSLSLSCRIVTTSSAAASAPGLKEPPSRVRAPDGDGCSRYAGTADGDPAAPLNRAGAAAGTVPADTSGNGSMAQKSHSSALCLIPERRIWAQLQEVRCFKDKVRCFLVFVMSPDQNSS